MSNNNTQYPFLFCVFKKDNYIYPDTREVDYWIVVIARYDLRLIDSDWMMDEDLPESRTCEPGIDLSGARHRFSGDAEGERLAKLFIKNWWMNLSLG